MFLKPGLIQSDLFEQDEEWRECIKTVCVDLWYYAVLLLFSVFVRKKSVQNIKSNLLGFGQGLRVFVFFFAFLSAPSKIVRRISLNSCFALWC